MKNTAFFLPLVLLLCCFSCQDNTTLTTEEESSSKKVVILAIDGGGIKGIIPAYFLTQLETQVGQQSYEMFDVIGGTSTGGILSMGLTTVNGTNPKPRTAQTLLNYYLTDCSDIFVASGESGPDYYASRQGNETICGGPAGVEIFLQEKFGTTTLSQAATAYPDGRVKQVFTTSYVINSSGGKIANPQMGVDFGPYLFNWYDAQNSSTDDYYVWEATRATSAAPTYFPVAHLGGGEGTRSGAAEKWTIDGGVMSNDPAVWAVSEALRTGIASSLDDLIVISLGCGLDRFNGGIGVTNEKANDVQPCGQEYGFWGSTDWGISKLYNLNEEDLPRSAVTQMALYANQFAPASQLELLAQGSEMQYVRIQPDLPANLTDMADCSNTAALNTFAQNYFSQGTGQRSLQQVVNLINNN